MILREIINLLQAQVLTGNGLLDAIEVERCFSADLMSDVLGRDGRYILASMHLMMNDVPVENA